MTVTISGENKFIELEADEDWEIDYEGDSLTITNLRTAKDYTFNVDGSFDVRRLNVSRARATSSPLHDFDVVRKIDVEEIIEGNAPFVRTETFENHDHSGDNGEPSRLEPNYVNVDKGLKLPIYASKDDATENVGLILDEEKDTVVYRRNG